MSEAPPSLNRPTWDEDTIVLPAVNVSGSSSVACWLVVLVNGSVLTRVSPPPLPLTVRVNVVVCVALVPVPVIVTGNVPAGVEVAVVSVSVEEPPEVTDVGLNEAAAPAGRPLADSDTVCAVPAVVAVDTVAVAEVPGFTAAEFGLTETEKSLAATLRLTSSYLVNVGSPAKLSSWLISLSV